MPEITQEMIEQLAELLGVTEEKAESLLKLELRRKISSKKYRQSDAYKRSLELQKEARKAIKEMGL